MHIHVSKYIYIYIYITIMLILQLKYHHSLPFLDETNLFFFFFLFIAINSRLTICNLIIILLSVTAWVTFTGINKKNKTHPFIFSRVIKYIANKMILLSFPIDFQGSPMTNAMRITNWNTNLASQAKLEWEWYISEFVICSNGNWTDCKNFLLVRIYSSSSLYNQLKK